MGKWQEEVKDLSGIRELKKRMVRKNNTFPSDG
jgi:hypothetical protein